MSKTKLSKEKTIRQRAGEVLSCHNDEELELAIDALRKALKKQPDTLADYIEGVTMWEKLEYSFTVRDLCEYIGISQ